MSGVTLSVSIDVIVPFVSKPASRFIALLPLPRLTFVGAQGVRNSFIDGALAAWPGKPVRPSASRPNRSVEAWL